jgi:hypothetical protein
MTLNLEPLKRFANDNRNLYSGGGYRYLEVDREEYLSLIEEIERLREVIDQAYKQTVELGQNCVVGPLSPRRFPISDLLELLGPERPTI